MTIEKITVSPCLTSYGSKNIRISYSLREKLKLPFSAGLVKVMCGRNSIFAKIVCINEEHTLVSIHQELLKDLSLPAYPFTISIKYNPEKRWLELGPVVAVLTEIDHGEKPVSLGNIDSFCRELAACSAEKGIFFYLFSLSEYHQEKMKGYTLNQNEWQECSVPHPGAVHNRIHSRTVEQSQDFLTMTADLIQHKVPYFNNRFLNKWEVHQILNANPHLTPFLPKTELLSSKTVLERMVHLYPVVFLKPINGSQGKRIFKIFRTDEGYELDYSTFSGHLLRDYLSFDDLFQSLLPRIKKEAYIVQEGIELLTYEKKPLDFRILCHKRNDSQWKISSGVARVSAENQFVANLARGGTLHKIREALSASFELSEAAHISKLLNELSLEIAETLGKYAGGLFAEFGMDLAVDSGGHPWIIEVNTKPSKHAGERKSLAARPSARSIIDYCLFLSESNLDEAH
ncbi:YheC/YheD family protein [Metabacillus idriensis]|uniref:YheC/YheD family endospore coat-associated protein n=1 Tax=Metabacillus idriensis TaxID=324768 RepID=UPI003D2C35BA